MVLQDMRQMFGSLVSLVESGLDESASCESIFENIPAKFSLDVKLKTLVVKSVISLDSMIWSLPPNLMTQVITTLEREYTSLDSLNVLKN